MRHGGFLLWVATVFALATAGQASMVLAQEGPPVNLPSEKPPNILLVLTDDQEESTLAHMPNVQEHLVAGGRTFENTASTYPLCCPGRVTLLTGRYPQNHGVTDNAGGFAAFKAGGLQQDNVTTWLDAAGYDTAYFGKYMNGYRSRLAPPGWDEWHAYSGKTPMGTDRISDGASASPTSSRVAAERIVAEEAEEWLAAREGDPDPFFAVVGFAAAHGPYSHPKSTDGMFAGVRIPRTGAFNEGDVSDKPSYVKERDPLGGREVKAMDADYRDSLRSLVRVDKFVGDAVPGLPEDTYTLYYTDNGTHLGHHRLGHGKRTPYETDLAFPLIVRGPGVPVGSTDALAGNHDVAPTLADLASVEPPAFADGRSLAPVLHGNEPAGWRTAVLSRSFSSPRNTAPVWEAVRTEDETYVEYANGERELYDLGADPDQLVNLLHEPTVEVEARAAELSSRLDTLKACEAEGCRAAEDASPLPDGPTP